MHTFDAAFFRISPREADVMDPQQRLLLEEIWHTLEDAGYPPSAISGSQTGVFMGVCNDDYNDLLLAHNARQDAYVSTGSYFSILANRISYLLNLHGPSVAIDTACSSSLIAMHHAIQAFQSGDCSLAFVGGVNLCLTPKRYCSFSHAGMLSPDGRCKTFDARANGYVRGEGVGVVLLKPLAQAVADGDHIYGVIKSTAVNHGGFANSLTAPNPNAQAELLVTAYERAQIDPATVTDPEAHGTGTSLGDPIEINGIKKAFEQLYARWNRPPATLAHCHIGSVKTHIGHLESAAGIAGVIKVLLAMQHHTLPANLHFQKLNPYIQLEGSPFSIVSESQTWGRLQDEQQQSIPRRAGVSSFGFGGANAHVVLEEYEDLRKRSANFNLPAPQLILLSAKNEDRLKAYAQEMAEFLEQREQHTGDTPLSLADVAYTLQVGREAMEERLALVVSSLDEVKAKFRQYAQGETRIQGIHQGNVKANKAISGLLIEGEEGQTFVQSVIQHKKLDKLAQFWVLAIHIDWNLLHPAPTPNRISLPTYPFAETRYWIPESEQTAINRQSSIVNPRGFIR